jgi:hypothetical protein
MNIAMGYRWFQTSAGYHMERAFSSLGFNVEYVGLSSAERPGYDSQVFLPQIINSFHEKPYFYLWVDPAGPYFPLGIEDLSILTACYIIDVHLGKWRQEVAKFFDVVFIAQKDYVDTYRTILGHDQVFWLPLAAATDVHKQLDLPRIYDVGFVGNIAVAHRNTQRLHQLKLIAENFRTNDFYRFYPPEEVGQVYSQSRIVFNMSIAGDLTMRIFEGTLCGALVISDSAKNGLNELFHVGKEIVLYTNVDDLLEKIQFYLAHDNKREQIAVDGQKRASQEHTYHHRVNKIMVFLGQPSLKKLAPMRSASSHKRTVSRYTIYTHLHMVDAILDIAKVQKLGPLGSFVKVLPALGRRLII